MKINIKNHLIQEGVVDHVKKHWGKYATGAGAIGLTKAAANGYLGVDAQDTVQDFTGTLAGDLENKSVYNNIDSSLDAAKQVFSKPDNLLTNWDDNEDTYKIQKIIQPATWNSVAQEGTAKVLRNVSDMDQSPDKENFIVRNPLTSTRLAMQNGTAYIKPFLGQ